MKIALYGMIEDIRARELKFWNSVPIHIRKLSLNQMRHPLCSSQVIASFSQIMFPWQHENMNTFHRYISHSFGLPIN